MKSFAETPMAWKASSVVASVKRAMETAVSDVETTGRLPVFTVA